MDIRRWLREKLLNIKANPLGALAQEEMAEKWGVGPEWSPSTYGEYYATSALIYSAVKLRADSIVRPPLCFYQVKDKNKEELSPDHPLSQLMRKVNPFWTRGDLWRATSTYLDLWGSAYWILTKDTSLPSEIWVARPDRMRIVSDNEGNIKGYTYQSGIGRSRALLPDEVVWFRHFNPLAEMSALSPIAPLRLSVDMASDALRSNRNLFKNGLLFSNVALQLTAPATDEQIESFYRLLQKRFVGPEKAHRPLVFYGGEFKNLGFSPKDMEHLNTLRWSLEDVSRVYGVPAMLLGDLTHSSYSNFREAQQMFWRNTIVPYLVFLQEEITEMLIRQFGDDLIAEFDLSQIEALQENFNEVATRQREDVKTGIITINEVRLERGLDPVSWGDSFWAPLGLYPVDGGGQQPGLPALQEGKLWKPPELSDANLDRIADLHVKRLSIHEDKFKEAQIKLFALQKKDVLKRLRAQKAIIKQFEPVFNPEDWKAKFEELGRPLIIAALINSAMAQIAEHGLGFSFNPQDIAVQDWLNARVLFWAQRVNEGTAELLMKELEAAIQAGESIKDIQARVEKVFKFSDEVRSERIARTETQAAMNYGAVEAYEQSGVVEEKMWLAVLDNRVRDDHREAHRQVVPNNAPFFVGGEMIMFPGDGSPEQSINCRCSVAPVISRRERALSKSMKKIITRDENGFPISIEEIENV